MKNLPVMQKLTFNRQHRNLLFICGAGLLAVAGVGLLPVLNETARVEEAIRQSQVRVTELQQLNAVRQELVAKLLALQELPSPPGPTATAAGPHPAAIRKLAAQHAAAVLNMRADLPSHSGAADAITMVSAFTGQLSALQNLAVDLLHLPGLLQAEQIQLRQGERGFVLETRLLVASDF